MSKDSRGTRDWMSVRIPSELADEIRAEAKDRGTTITKVVEGRLKVKVIDVTDEPKQVGVDADPSFMENALAAARCTHQHTLKAQTGIICLDCRAVLKR